MTSDERKKRAGVLVDSYIKFRVVAELPGEVIAALANVELNPSDENLSWLERCNNQLLDYIDKKAEQSRQTQSSHQPQPEMYVAGRTFIN